MDTDCRQWRKMKYYLTAVRPSAAAEKEGQGARPARRAFKSATGCVFMGGTEDPGGVPTGGLSGKKFSRFRRWGS